ncbi:MAG TPA: glycosyltransferase family 4 protein [Anaerolineae bacterium]|nr:glycosyltransferase family 4 protein [Anaerolineae bacterium]
MSSSAAPIRILFNTWANADNINAQSLNARDIALRLNPQQFHSTLFVGARQTPDARFVNQSHIQLKRVPARLGSAVIARELLWGKYNILFYPALNERASQVYRSLQPLGRRKRVVETVEGSIAQIRALSPDQQIQFQKNLARADCVVAITPAIADGLRKEFGIVAQVIPVGVGRDFFQPVPHHLNGARVRVLTVASIQPRKQIHLILEMARRLQNQSVEFHIIGAPLGGTAYQDGLLAEKARDGLENVTFHGGLLQAEIRDWMARSDIFVLPSRLEGLPKVTLEAAAMGLPIVVFDDYETPSVVNGVTGFQVKTFEELVERVCVLLQNARLRVELGRAGREHVKQFDWNGIARQWERVFESLGDAWR